MNKSMEKEKMYDVAHSFAGEQRDYVREVARTLKEVYGLEVFLMNLRDIIYGERIYMTIFTKYIQKRQNM